MIHACDRGGSVPSCAVPVLPPTSKPGTSSRVAVPPSTTPSIASRIRSAVASVHGRGPHLGVVGVDDVAVGVADVAEHVRAPSPRRRWRPPPATIAICSGVAATSFWPMDDWASAGRFRSKSVGKFDRAGSVRSIGTSWLNPKASAVSIIGSGPVSTPIWAKAVLHDTRRIWNSAPPQDEPPKFRIGRVVPGGVYALLDGVDGLVGGHAAVSDAGGGGHDLEGGAGEEALLVGAGQAGLLRVGVEERAARRRPPSVSWLASRFGS